MPLQQAIWYQAFREITNFIRNNGDDWDKFCAKTAHTTKKAREAPNPFKQPSKHKIGKNKGLLAPDASQISVGYKYVLFGVPGQGQTLDLYLRPDY